MDIHRLDLDDDAAWADWHATYLASDTYGRSFATPWMSNELRTRVRTPSSSETFVPFAGVDDGRTVATGWLETTLKDNLDIALLEVHVHPTRRREGLGSRMLEYLEQLVKASGRSTILIEVNHSFESGPDARGSAGAEFLRAHGYELALGSIWRRVELPVPPEVLSRLAEEAAPFHNDYTLRSFVGPWPDDVVEPLGRLAGMVGIEAPTGDLELEAEVFDVERVREDDEVSVAAGRTKYTTAAFAPDGSLVAYTEIVVPREDPGRSYQWGTLVVPEHRGHRLGMAVKVRNLELLQAHEPGVTSLSTCNAEVNAAMVGINETLGFEPVERLAEFQKRLSVQPVGADDESASV